jgi:hypothetical protein
MNEITTYLVTKRFNLKRRIKILKTNIKEIEIMEYDLEEEHKKIMNVFRKIDLCNIEIDDIDEMLELSAGIKDSSDYKTSEILDMFQVRV